MSFGRALAGGGGGGEREGEHQIEVKQEVTWTRSTIRLIAAEPECNILSPPRLHAGQSDVMELTGSGNLTACDA